MTYIRPPVIKKVLPCCGFHCVFVLLELCLAPAVHLEIDEFSENKRVDGSHTRLYCMDLNCCGERPRRCGVHRTRNRTVALTYLLAQVL